MRQRRENTQQQQQAKAVTRELLLLLKKALVSSEVSDPLPLIYLSKLIDTLTVSDVSFCHGPVCLTVLDVVIYMQVSLRCII